MLLALHNLHQRKNGVMGMPTSSSSPANLDQQYLQDIDFEDLEKTLYSAQGSNDLNRRTSEIRERKISNNGANKPAQHSGHEEYPPKHHHHIGDGLINIVVTLERKISVQSQGSTHSAIERKISTQSQASAKEKEAQGQAQVHSRRKSTNRIYRKSTQILAAFAANMGAFALGTVLAWSSTAVPSLRRSTDVGTISEDDGAWISSIVTLGALASCPAAAFLMVTLGRRNTMVLLTPLFTAGWLMIRFHASFLPNVDFITKIYVGRFLTGFCGGAYSVLTPVYIAETAHEKIRGGLAGGFDLMLSVGMLYIFAIGGYTSWQVQTVACSLIPIVLLFFLFIVPESPRFLVEKGRLDAAAKAIKWLYGISEDEVHEEMLKLMKSVEESQARPVNFDRVIMKMSVLKPILLAMAIITFYTLCGVDAVIFYTVDIFESTGAGLDPKVSTIIVGTVQLVATIPALFIVDKYGRRPLLIASEALMAVALAGMGIFYYLTAADDEARTLHMFYAWLPLLALNLFIIAYSLGVGPLAMALLGELIPSHIKGITTCGALMLRWILGFGVTIFFENLGAKFGLDITYWGFAFLCVIGALFVLMCLPETKGKSLDEIQTSFIHPVKFAKQQQQQQQQRQSRVSFNFGDHDFGFGPNQTHMVHVHQM